MASLANPITLITSRPPQNSAQVGTLEHNGRIYDIYVTFEDRAGNKMPIDRTQKVALEALQTQNMISQAHYQTTIAQLTSDLIEVHKASWPSLASEDLSRITEKGLFTNIGQIYPHDKSKHVLQDGEELLAKDFYEVIAKTLLETLQNSQKRPEEYRPVINLVPRTADAPTELEDSNHQA